MMARWMIFRWWSAAKSCRNGRIIRISARGGIAPCAFTRSSSVSPSMYAITTYAVPFCSNKSSRGTSGGKSAIACRKRYPRTNRAQYRAKSATPLAPHLKFLFFCNKNEVSIVELIAGASCIIIEKRDKQFRLTN